MIETHPVVGVTLSSDRLERSLEHMDRLDLRSPGGASNLPGSFGLEIEQFLLHRMRGFSHAPKVLGRLKNGNRILGLVTQRPDDSKNTPLNRFNFFESYSEEIPRLKALVRVFLNFFYELHMLHGPEYQDHLLADAGQEIRPSSPFHFSNNLIFPSNLNISTPNDDKLPRGSIMRFNGCTPAAAVQHVISKRNVYHPPDSTENQRVSDGCSWDLFAMGIILFGALSPSGTEYADTCLGLFSSSESQAQKKPEVRYSQFLFDSIDDVFGSKEETTAFFSSCTWIDPFPEESIDGAKSAFQNLSVLNLNRWPCLKPDNSRPDLGPLLDTIIQNAVCAPYAASKKPTCALDLFQMLWSVWQKLHPDCPESNLISDTFPDFGLPEEFQEVSQSLKRLKIPASAKPTAIPLDAFETDRPLSSVTLDYRCASLVHKQHIIKTEINLSSETPLSFPMVEISPGSGVQDICFVCSEIPDGTVSRDAFLEFGPFTNPGLIHLDFEPGLESTVFEKPLNLEYLEKRISELFPNACLPDDTASLKAMWRQFLDEFDPELLENDRAAWYRAIAVLTSNILMLPKSLRQELGLFPLIPDQYKWKTHDLAKQIVHLDSFEGLIRYPFEVSFKIAACLHLLKRAADDLEEEDFDALEKATQALENLTADLQTSQKDQIVESLDFFKACSEIYQIQQPKSKPCT